jgi:hypothetical protein
LFLTIVYLCLLRITTNHSKMNEQTIIEKFQEQEIAFDLLKGDLMVNATEMAKPFGKGKRPSDFLRLKSTEALIQAMKMKSNYSTSAVVNSDIILTKEGQHGGTFMCEDLALAFAMWLSPDFHVWILQTLKEIIFGNNPELVKEAVMNMPRIQKELDKLRRKRNRLKALILGPERRKEFSDLVNKRQSINYQIQNLTYLPTIKSLKLDADSLGDRMIKLIEERDQLDEAIQSKNQEFEKLLVVDEYRVLVQAITELEREQRHFSKMIRYSDVKFSNN